MPAINQPFEYKTGSVRFPEGDHNQPFEVNTESIDEGIKSVVKNVKKHMADLLKPHRVEDGHDILLKDDDFLDIPNGKIMEDDSVTNNINELFKMDFNTEGVDMVNFQGDSVVTKYLTTPFSNIESTIGITHGGPHYEEHMDEHTYVYIWLGVVLGIVMLIGLILAVIYILYKRRGSHEIQAKKLDNETKNHGEQSVISQPMKSGVKGHMDTKGSPVKN